MVLGDNDPNYAENIPHASSLIESLRDIGYTFKAALADIVDNSIAANARNIDIHVRWNAGDPVISIVDDGHGMTDEELREAMRPGSRSPAERREKHDLGRFGLGMKTASFSQCRRLTVCSLKDGILSGYRWDLDTVSEKNSWLMERVGEDEFTNLTELRGTMGTIVIWEKIDRVVDITVDNPEVRFNEKLDRARAHLSLVFHRFISGEPGLKRIGISINATQVAAFDPFNKTNSATQQLPPETIVVGAGTVEIRPYILPHHSKVTREEFDKYAGEEGYVRSQGFYVYRNCRLIDYGTWFRLAPLSDANRLARVQIDIGNESDHLWQVDVKKSRVSPPSKIRNALRRVIERITGNAKRVYSARGHVRRHQIVTPIWERHASQGRIEYRVKRDHPLVSEFVSELEENGARFEDLIKLVESSYPRNQLFADMSSDPKNVDVGLEKDEIYSIARRVYEKLESTGTDSETIERMLTCSEPFASYDGLLDKIRKDSAE